MNRFWGEIRRRWGGEQRPVVGARAGEGRKATAPLALPVLGGSAAGPYGPPAEGISGPKIPAQPPHEPPLGRPGWWSAALPQSRLIYPDDSLDRLLEEMRRTVPILDRAIAVLTGLCGRLEFAASKSVLAELNQWAGMVKVNQTGKGLQGWLEAHIDAMLLYGLGVSEVVPGREALSASPRDVYALMNLDPRTIVFQVTDDPLVLLPLQRQHTNAFLAALNPETLLMSVNGGHTDTPHGWSLYRSLPFVAQAARSIENATAQAWQRMGCPSYHVNWEAPPTFSDPSGALAAATLANLQAQWNQTMAGRAVGAGGAGSNSVADFFTAVKVTVEVIGHDHTPLPLSETWRVFEEQLVAATGLPSWLLGFHWATTERMALQQSEILVAQIEAIRRHAQPAVERLIDLRQRLAGRSGRVRVGWSKITLHDLTEQARGRAWEQQARQRAITNAAAMWQLGFWDQAQALADIDPDAGPPATPHAAPPTAPKAGGDVVGPSEGYHG